MFPAQDSIASLVAEGQIAKPELKNDDNASMQGQKRAWVNPQLVCLAMGDTAAIVTGGSDGGAIGFSLS